MGPGGAVAAGRAERLPAGFVLDPQGKVTVSAYSSGAIGRLVPDDVIGLVRYLHEHAAASS